MGRRSLMLIWRLSIARYAEIFDGGYGLLNEGRWNSRGMRITYAATSPALCVLEKLVHIEDPALLPPLRMVTYSVPDGLEIDENKLSDLEDGWPLDSAMTRRLGDGWLKRATAPIMKVPSAVLPVTGSPDLNILINHTHPDAARISIHAITDFLLDARLLD
ncbi:RES family NAD+ phosphorylase [Rhizobium sp.]